MSKNISKGWQVITYKDLEEKKAEENNPQTENQVENTQEKTVLEKSQKEDITASTTDNSHILSAEKSEKKSSESLKSHHKHFHPLIWGDLSTKPYWQRNLVPVLMEMFFLLFCFEFPVKYILHVKFVFYTALLLFYIFTQSISFKKIWRNIMTGFHFWKATLVCVVMYGAVFTLTQIIIHYVPTINLGFYPMTIKGPFTLVLFAITTMFLAPIVEETFFRGNLISFHSKRFIILTSVVSVLLYAIDYAFSPWAILIAIIWAVPMTLIFLKTRNFYVTMGAHFIVSLLNNLPIIIKFLAVGA